MSGQLLSEDEWGKNVGTPAFPVSFLHEYAVGLLWDALHNQDEVKVKTIDGSLSGNLKEQMDRVVIPDSMQPIGGCVPDLAVLDKELRPVRVIEVVVTSPPTKEKTEKLSQLEKRGVEVVQVPVRNEDELKALVTSKFEESKPNWAYHWNHKLLDQVGIINIPRQQAIVSGQRSADRQVEDLMRALFKCSPDVRRQLVEVLHEIDGLESCLPLSPKNPKRVPHSSDIYDN